MSRVGKMPVSIPAGVDVSIKGDQIHVKGAGGALQLAANTLVNVNLDGGALKFAPANESREADAMTGTMRQLVNNMVIGVTDGFRKELDIVGVGYRAAAKGDTTIDLQLGFSHPVSVDAPAGVTFVVPQPTRIEIHGIDKQLVGQVAANIRSIRKPEPYKGKGVRYLGEKVLRKAGKTGKK